MLGRRRRLAGKGAWAGAGLLGLLLGAALADSPAAGDSFWTSDQRSGAAAAAQLVGLQEPFAILALRYEGQRQNVWQELGKHLPQGLAPALDEDLLDRTRNVHQFPDVRGRPRDEWRDWEAASYDLLCQALRYAAFTPQAAEAFARSAAPQRDVTWGDMFREPWKYRGKVVPVQGRLKMLRRRDAPLGVQGDGITTYYEGWVFTDTPGSNPVCVLVLKLPDGIQVGEKVDYRVECHGYFLMRYHYLTAGRGWRDTLLFVAPTFHRRAAPPAAEDNGSSLSSMSSSILTGLIILVAGTLLLVLGLSWWFRRGDRRFAQQRAHVQATMFATSDLGEPTSSGQQPVGAVLPADTPQNHREPWQAPVGRDSSADGAAAT
jgi:hypothetical protein